VGHRKYSSPRHGSLAYLPRGRAARLLPRVKYWPSAEGEVSPLGFVGFKAGMTSAYFIDNIPNSPTEGLEIQKAATIVATPPLRVVGVAVYERVGGVLRELLRIWSDKFVDEIRRRVKGLNANAEQGLRKLEGLRQRIGEVRLIVATDNKLVGAGKTPHIAEIKVGGETQKALQYALGRVGEQVAVSEVFKPGQYVDLLAVSKGKGFQGVVKRYGVAILQRKSRKTRRGVASIGPWHPAYLMYTVPRSGQMGYQRRTEFNKRILLISGEAGKYTPKGGFNRFGLLRSEFVVLEGSVAGTPKRPVILRAPARPPNVREAPQVTLIKV